MQNSQLDLKSVYHTGLRSIVKANYYMVGGTVTQRATTNPPTGAVELTPAQCDAMIQQGTVNTEEVTQGSLRSEVSILAAYNTFTWPITESDTQAFGQAASPTMNLISQNDSFLVNGLAYSLVSYAQTAGQVTNIDATANNDWSPITYVDAYHGNSATVVMDQGNGLLWFGAYISMNVNHKVLVPTWDCEKHYHVPLTQTSTSQVPPFTLQKNTFDASSDHYYPVQPNIVLGGMRKNLIKLNLPTNIPASIAPYNLNGGTSPWIYGTGSTGNLVYRAVINFQGLLMQNSTIAK